MNPQIFSYAFLIYLYSLLPLPSLPISILSYNDLGLKDGFIANIISVNLSFITQFVIGKFFIRKLLFKYKYLEKFRNFIEKVNYLNIFELILFKISSMHFSKIFNYGLGMAGFKLNKVLFINNIGNFPLQLFAYFSATKIDIIFNFFRKYNINLKTSNLLLFFMILSLFIIFRKIIYFIKKGGLSNQ